MPTPPPSGLYDLLVTDALALHLDELSEVERRPLGVSESARRLGLHLGAYVARALESVPDSDRPGAQVAIVNGLLRHLAQSLGDFVDDGDHLRAELLEAIGAPRPRPELPLSESALYVNARRERRIGHALRREIASADRVDLICAFLGWDGFRELRPELERHLAAGRSLRLITTTYRGITDPRVLDELVRLGAEIRVSYRSDVTRLHAKAWLFHRDSGFSTAFIGSSNLSRSALTAGLEWNVRVSEIENRAVLDEFRAAFAGYWSDAEFEPYDPERFARELRTERPDLGTLSVFELRARSFQQEILDRLQAERELHDRHRHLVVAATGTGKTVIAALDYQRLSALAKRRLTLLFIAHRREILAQSRDTFRHAMSDASFGERLVDGRRPLEWQHVFASIQSLANEDVATWDPRRFDVVIVDEFHHAQGETYQRVLRHLAPRELLGLTATPERADGASILHWFDNRVTAELRLWDAIDRGLLVPFHYFAVHDVASLAGIRWTRGRLDPAQLSGLYTGHHARAHLIVKAVRDHVADPNTMRALGFCASVSHASFMAEAFELAGLPARAITAETPAREREEALAALRNGGLRCVFAVDVFNEGVDLPEVDTVLFLRPTESATVFVQQLGRGLRRAPGKRSLTVLDFVAEASREFRYDLRYRALLGGVGRRALEQQVADDFPLLPSGCVIQLDRASKEVILANLARSLRLDRRALTAELRALGKVDLGAFLASSGLELGDLYRGERTLTELARAAGLDASPPGPIDEETTFARGLARLIHVDDRARIVAWSRLIAGHAPNSELDRRLAHMLATTLAGRSAQADPRPLLSRHPSLRAELSMLLAYLDARLDHQVLPFRLQTAVPLGLHAHYRLNEIMAAFGDVRADGVYLPREGEHFDPATRANLLFVTLVKDERDYSASTLYRDYAMGPRRFHWQSQNATRPTDKKGLRHLEHEAQGVTPLLFVREAQLDDRGERAPYIFLGPVKCAAWAGERPMNIEWELAHPMPPTVLRAASVVV